MSARNPVDIWIIKPLNDRVLVPPDEAKKQIGNILLPDTAREKPSRGLLLAVGEDCKDSIRKLIGQRVFFHDYSGSKCPGHEELSFMREADLLGVEAE